jgi:hypothetical protein
MTVDEYRECARIHFREAERLLERARMAQIDDRQHEALLLADLSIAQRKRGEEYLKAARGEGGDPIVDEILDGLQEMRNNYVLAEGQRVNIMELQSAVGPNERIKRALAWITHTKRHSEATASNLRSKQL